MNTVKASIFTAGFCTCPEHFTLQRGSRRKIRFPAMFVLFEHPRFGAMLFDTGYSYRFFEETLHFPNRLYRMLTPVTLHEEQLAINQIAALNLRATDISKIFISHFHADHIAALGDFPCAQYIYLPQAFTSVRNRHGLSALSRAYLPGLIPVDFSERSKPIDLSTIRPLPSEYAPFTCGFDLLGDGSLLAVELPGHAAGQMGLFAHDESGTTYFFIADAAWLIESVIENHLPHWLASFFFSDSQAYRTTLANLHRFHKSRSDVIIIPSHCETTLARFSRHA
jgi:glyoxylase-like metal-dependent hydrolase (beta-lactamase superfamily II)